MDKLKHDTGKSRAGCLEDFSLALACIAEIFDAGAEEGYARGSWVEVDPLRYKDAEWRHRLQPRQRPIDSKSGRPHKWHEIWNMLAQLELEERSKLEKHKDHYHESVSITPLSVTIGYSTCDCCCRGLLKYEKLSETSISFQCTQCGYSYTRSLYENEAWKNNLLCFKPKDQESSNASNCNAERPVPCENNDNRRGAVEGSGTPEHATCGDVGEGVGQDAEGGWDRPLRVLCNACQSVLPADGRCQSFSCTEKERRLSNTRQDKW